MVSKRNLPFQDPVFRFHLSFRVCISNRVSSWWTCLKNDPSKSPWKEGAFCWQINIFANISFGCRKLQQNFGANNVQKKRHPQFLCVQSWFRCRKQLVFVWPWGVGKPPLVVLFWVTWMAFIPLGGSEQGPCNPHQLGKKGKWSIQKVLYERDDVTFFHGRVCHNGKNSTYNPTRSPPIDGGFGTLEFSYSQNGLR